MKKITVDFCTYLYFAQLYVVFSWVSGLLSSLLKLLFWLHSNFEVVKKRFPILTYLSAHLWFPGIFEFKGGIQVYSAFLLDAFYKAYPSAKLSVFLKNDSAYSAQFFDSKAIQFHYGGHFPSRLRTPAFAMELVASALKESPELILATHVNYTAVACWLKQFLGIPYWVVAHGIEVWDLKDPKLIKGLRYADRILSVSEYTRQRLLSEQNLDPNQVVLLPNTFDHTRFQIAPKPDYLLHRYNLTPDQPVMLTVGRLDAADRYKGYDQILQALPQIRQQIPNVHYLLVGKGKDRSRIEQLIASLNLQDYVTLAGFIPDSELGDHYNLCDVFAMPSKGEGFGIVYLEAIACGKPTLGGNQDGALDALKNGEMGALVNPDDIGEIADAISQLLQGTYPNPTLYQPQVLRQKVLDYYGFEQFKLTLESLLNSRFM